MIAFLLLVYGLHAHLTRPDPEQPMPQNELVLNLPSLPEFIVEPEPEPEQPPVRPPQSERDFVLSDHAPESTDATEDAILESDRNTVATSRQGPDSNAAADRPSLDGDGPEESLGVVDTQFQDGEQPDATPPPAVAEAVVEPQPPAEPTQESPPVEPAEATDPVVAATNWTDPLADPLAETELLVPDPVPEPESDLPPTDLEEEPSEELPPDELPEEPQDSPSEREQPPSEPREPTVPDPIQLTPSRVIEQRTRSQEGGAELGEIDSFLAMRTAEGVYKRQLYGVIEKKWRRLTDANLAMKTFSQVKVAVVIKRDGSIVSARITESAASPAMREAALRAVEEATLPAVPEVIPAPYYYSMEFLIY